MQDAATAGTVDIAGAHVSGGSAQAGAGRLRVRLIAGVLAVLALVSALGLSAYSVQRRMHVFARDVYDRAFIGLSHLDAAQVAFLRYVAAASDAAATIDPTARRTALTAVTDQLGIVIERAGSSALGARAAELRNGVAQLDQPGVPSPERLSGIETGLTGLVRAASRQALSERDKVEVLAGQCETFLLAATTGAVLFVILASLTVNRAIRSRQLSLARIAHISRHDSLTELPNRAAFLDALRYASMRAARGENFAVLCLDLDRFKQVNDTLGHPVGDGLLRAVAERLRQLTREVDVVARLGGDEFAILLLGISGPDFAALLAQRLVDELGEPYDLVDHRVVIGASVGIALGTAVSRQPDTLMRNADLALYRAKQEGRSVYRFFEPGMDARAQARRRLELDLREAVEREEFELHYQPLVSVADRSVASFEALIRWNHPTRGQVPPDEFIPLAEEIGLIVPIGAWVLQRACLEAAGWPKNVGVGVNLSAAQFARSDILEQVRDALAESGLAPARLELEITESVLLQDSKGTIDILHELRKLGVRIAMDDFGTGYSSLSYLRSFPFDKLKIDRSFIRDLGHTGESAAIIRAIAAMGLSLGITTTAEGVETQQQMAQLVGDGCSELQGYFFSRPCKASDVPRMLAENALRQAG